MGLGKTLTILSYLKMLKEKLKRQKPKETIITDSTSLKTLIVIPASLFYQWQKEIDSKFKQYSFIVGHFYKDERKKLSKSKLEECDIVLTTYQTVLSDTNVLKQIEWNRIICDEGHKIKNIQSKTAKALCSLNSRSRIILSGTPIQNEIAELYSYLKFFKMNPFDEIHVFESVFENKNNPQGVDYWIQSLSEFLLLRRNKSDIDERTNKKIVDLPDKDIKLIEFELNESENFIYSKIEEESRQQAESLLRGQFTSQTTKNIYGKDLYSRILVYLLRLRQACSHFNLMINNDKIVNEDELENLENEFIQEIKFKSIDSIQSVGNSYLKNCFFVEYQSSKLLELRKYLDKLLVEYPNDKIIIVSQWTSFLNIIGLNLIKSNIWYCEITGEINLEERERTIDMFNDETNMDYRIMLLSLGSGGVGLNLVGANHLFLLDMHWNPAHELQVFDRIHRIGQKKKVNIYKFMCKNTIEQRIFHLHEKKLKLADKFCNNLKSFNVDSNFNKLSINDIRNLFEIHDLDS